MLIKHELLLVPEIDLEHVCDLSMLTYNAMQIHTYVVCILPGRHAFAVEFRCDDLGFVHDHQGAAHDVEALQIAETNLQLHTEGVVSDERSIR